MSKDPAGGGYGGITGRGILWGFWGGGNEGTVYGRETAGGVIRRLGGVSGDHSIGDNGRTLLGPLGNNREMLRGYLGDREVKRWFPQAGVHHRGRR